MPDNAKPDSFPKWLLGTIITLVAAGGGVAGWKAVIGREPSKEQSPANVPPAQDPPKPKNKKPIARLTVNPVDGIIPLTYKADAGASSDPDDTRLSYKWRVDGADVAGNQSAVSGTLTQSGPHVVEVIVSDGVLVDSARVDVTASPRPVTKLGDENFACSASNGEIRIIDRDGHEHRVGVSGTSGHIPVNNKSIIWYCGNSQEDWSPPSGVDFIIVSRKTNGAGVVEYYDEL